MDSAGNTRCSKGTPKRIEFWAPLLVLIVVAAVLRVAYARDQALWADELFSLALATGHSLEGPPFTWDAARRLSSPGRSTCKFATGVLHRLPKTINIIAT